MSVIHECVWYLLVFNVCVCVCDIMKLWWWVFECVGDGYNKYLVLSEQAQ